MNDAAMLAEIPEYITLGSAFLKATPAEEAGERLYARVGFARVAEVLMISLPRAAGGAP